MQGCLGNGRPQAAEYLASRGAPLDLESAAGLGRVKDVTRLVARASRKEIIAAFSLACAYGRAPVIDFFLSHDRVEIDTELKSHGDGHTGLHVAAFHGQLEAVKVLLQHSAHIHAIEWDKAQLDPKMLAALRTRPRST